MATPKPADTVSLDCGPTATSTATPSASAKTHTAAASVLRAWVSPRPARHSSTDFSSIISIDTTISAPAMAALGR